MTTPAIKLLHDAIAEAGVPAGFRKRGSSWYSEEAEAILLINPQKSQYGVQYFLNIGLYWKKLGSKATPKEEECHLRGRVSGILPEEENRSLELSLDFEDASIDDARRKELIRDALVQHVIPFLERCSTTEGLRNEHRKGTLRRFLIMKSLAAEIDQ